MSDEYNKVFHLDIAIGKLKEIANSEAEFRRLVNEQKYREEWFAECDEQNAASRGLTPNESQCIGFDVPLVFAESRSSKPYIADLYQYVALLGDLNRQLAAVPDGGEVKLKLEPPPKNPQ